MSAEGVARGAVGAGGAGLVASFEHVDATVSAIKKLRKAGFEEIVTYSPLPEHHIEEAMGYGPSIVRVFTLVGGLSGAAAGFALTTFTSVDFPLVTGGKPIVSIPAFIVIAFELTVLFGALAAVIGVFITARLPSIGSTVVYDPEFSAGRFGVHVVPPPDRLDEARKILEDQSPIELREGAEGSPRE